MKLLLDENLPKQLKRDFASHQIFTVRDMGWNGLRNGELLQRMLAEGFHALITFDKNLRYQQNFAKYPITVFVLVSSSNTYGALTRLSAVVLNHLERSNLPSGPIIISSSSVGG